MLLLWLSAWRLPYFSYSFCQIGAEIKQATFFPAGTMLSSCFCPVTCVTEEMSANIQRSKKDSLNVVHVPCSERFFFRAFFPLIVIFNISNISPVFFLQFRLHWKAKLPLPWFRYSHATLNNEDTFWETHREAISSSCVQHRMYLRKPR
jgi:hypothetical protein